MSADLWMRGRIAEAHEIDSLLHALGMAHDGAGFGRPLLDGRERDRVRAAIRAKIRRIIEEEEKLTA